MNEVESELTEALEPVHTYAFPKVSVYLPDNATKYFRLINRFVSVSPVKILNTLSSENEYLTLSPYVHTRKIENDVNVFTRPHQ